MVASWRREELRNLLALEARDLGFELTLQQVDLFGIYLQEVREWNERINLTSIIDEEEIIVKHFLDSLTCLRAASFGDGIRVIDVGTGAGFPGIPVKICRPTIKLTLLDSLGKRISFLRHLCLRLHLSDVELIQGRAEEFGRTKGHREAYHRVLARGVAPLRVLAEYCLPFLMIGGLFLAFKGPRGREELGDAVAAIDLLGGEVRDVVGITLPRNYGRREVLVIQKIRATPPTFPRRVGVPARNPLA